MRIGLVISFYDEYDIVKNTCDNILSYFKNSKIVLVESNLYKTYEYPNVSKHINLKNIYDFYKKTIINTDEFKYRWMSHSLTRNFSIGFNELYKIDDNYDLVIGMLGDTLIFEPNFLNDILNIFNNDNKLTAGVQPIGQTLHHRLNIIECDFLYKNIAETDDSTVISPVFFVAEGKFAQKNKLFTEIINTNELTFEQSLGDNVKYLLDDFKEKFLRLNDNKYDCYSFKYNGIKFHSKNSRPGRTTYD